MASDRSIDPRRYSRGRNKGKASPVQVNIRMRRRGRTVPTRAEVVAALQELLDTGEVPRGWQFAAINWEYPAKGTTQFREGVVDDIEAFRPMIIASMGVLRLGVVENGEVRELER